MRVGEKFTMALAHTLNWDGTPDTGYFAQRDLCFIWWAPNAAEGRTFSSCSL
ncbi:hypothetical protein SLEP1_g11518 [Rubroshorea leprosula]|uniref:Uncharacterized protein n=1 Tax=Rubroshorea leprosula TaxID=152421 RepID=A0AAV5IHC1_9ROSI|nr:hypothetical protein SLEP1_g11518 [Rubroshorea leprosula]